MPVIPVIPVVGVPPIPVVAAPPDPPLPPRPPVLDDAVPIDVLVTPTLEAPLVALAVVALDDDELDDIEAPVMVLLVKPPLVLSAAGGSALSPHAERNRPKTASDTHADKPNREICIR